MYVTLPFPFEVPPRRCRSVYVTLLAVKSSCGQSLTPSPVRCIYFIAHGHPPTRFPLYERAFSVLRAVFLRRA